MMKKKRCDRNHVIYRITAATGDSYIGLTVAQGAAYLRSVKVRVQKHLSRARREDKQWALYQFLNTNPDVDLWYEVVDVVRGRKPAHQREREIIKVERPTLNTF